MAKNRPANKELTPRQQRRQQQRDTIIAARAQPLPVESLQPLSPPSELLGPSIWVPLLCASIVLGCMLYHVSGLATTKGNELTWPQPLFTAVNAATLTGFQQARNPNEYTTAGQVLTLFLTIMGMLFSFICGGVAILRIARLKFSDFKLITWSCVCIVLVAIVGGTVLTNEDRTFGQGLFAAISAFGNSGLMIGKLPAAGSGPAMLVMLPLAVLGGLGIPVLMELSEVVRRRAPLSHHSRTVLSWTAGVYLAIAAVMFVLQLSGPHGDTKSVLTDTVQLTINTRSAGFAFSAISNLPQATTFVLVLSMIIGASPGGSGGGVKVTTLATITTGVRDTLAGRTPGRRFGAALLWLGTYLGLLTLSTVALLMTEPEIHLDRTLFLCGSALGNVGLSHNPIDVQPGGMYVLCATMLMGRVAPVLMLWYLIDTTPDAVVAVG